MQKLQDKIEEQNAMFELNNIYIKRDNKKKIKS